MRKPMLGWTADGQSTMLELSFIKKNGKALAPIYGYRGARCLRTQAA
jgi:hypothetical protein